MPPKMKEYNPHECYTLVKDLEKDKKVKPSDVFEGYKPPKAKKKKKCPKGHPICTCPSKGRKDTKSKKGNY